MEKQGDGSEKKGPSPVKLGGAGAQAADTGRVTKGSVPGRQELWACPGLHTGESEVLARAKQGTSLLSKGPSLKYVQASEEEETQECREGSFSSVGSAASVMTDPSSKHKAINPFAWPHSQELRPPGNMGCFRDQRRPGLGGGTLGAEPNLKGCVTQVAALQIHPDCRHHAM